MPAFDPVRDAVRNSPMTPSNDLNFALFGESPTSPSTPVLLSPSLSRSRATDLSVLLNASSKEPTYTSSRPPRSAALSNILLSDAEQDKLSNVESFKRSDRGRGHEQPDNPFYHPPPPARRASQTIDLTDDVFEEEEEPAPRPIRPAPTASQSYSRPSSATTTLASTSNSRPTTAKSTSPPKKPKIPYDPKRRLTPATSVLSPMTPQEMQMYKAYVGIGAARLKNRKRERSPDLDTRDQPPSKKRARDVEVVVEHYNARPDVGVAQRQNSPIYGLKAFNNWVKSVLITRFAHPALAQGKRSERGNTAGKVLDMGCGKGGDITKWFKARIKELVAVDIARVSVQQAQARWEQSRNPRFEATFGVVDCYVESLAKVIPTAALITPFDVVSMQFCMHYAFETEKKARCMLENVTRWLRPGGVFVGTIPNADLLLEHLNALPEGTEDLSFGNSVYKIRFEDRKRQPIYGHKYWFYLQDAVDDVPEYVVRWDNFVQLASEYGLEQTYCGQFHQFFEEYQDVPEFKQLMERMNVVDANGESSMDEDQWEAANIYLGFAFKKR